MRFYNRENEISALDSAWESDYAQFVLLYGRRRIGKTYLLQHFLGKDKPHCYYLAAQTSFSDNMSQLAEAVISCKPESGFSPVDIPTFRSILSLVENIAGNERFALVLDEFQYLLEQDPSLPSQIQAWWDTSGIRSNIFLVLCGSHLGVMEGLGGHQAPLFGRFTVRQKLPPMRYYNTAQFYSDTKYSTREKLITYGVLGGTPRYHALFDSKRSLKNNICNIILNPTGLLHSEPEVLISSSQVRDPSPYNGVLRAIAGGCTRSNAISQRVGVAPNQLNFYMKNLIEWEWVIRERPLGERSDSRAIYRINDHFVHFWYRFVSKLRSELEFNDTDTVYEARIKPHIDQYMGQYVFEDICHQYLRLNGSNVIGKPICNAGRYWSRDGSVEIDIAAELDGGRQLFGECKWSSSPVNASVYMELRDKIARLPRLASAENPLYILFSLSGFTDDLQSLSKSQDLILISGSDLLCQSDYL
ncbi:MAG: DUF234 domain-containing protein [Armatimonadota bacterium]